MQALNVMLLGAIAMACVVAGLFFLRFWQQSRDRFFLLFASSFFLEGANRVALALSPHPSDGTPIFYGIRFVAFLLILIAIANKNRPDPVAALSAVAIPRDRSPGWTASPAEQRSYAWHQRAEAAQFRPECSVNPGDASIYAISFEHVVVLFPVAQALHVWEEWPGFPRWARRFASSKYSDREYIVTHIAAVSMACVAVLLVRALPTPVVIFSFFALIFGPGIGWNAMFHTGAALRSRTYPGVVTGLLVYVPLSVVLAVLAVRDGLIGGPALVTAYAPALVFHILEVGHNVFKRW